MFRDRRDGSGRACLGSGACGMGTRLAIVSIAFEITVKTSATDTENLGGAEAIAVAHLKDFLDVGFPNFFQRKRLPVFVAREAR